MVDNDWLAAEHAEGALARRTLSSPDEFNDRNTPLCDRDPHASLGLSDQFRRLVLGFAYGVAHIRKDSYVDCELRRSVELLLFPG